MTDYIPSNLEELYEYPPQDVHDPVWTGDETIHGMTGVDDPNDDVLESRHTTSIRKADGGIDFLNEIETELRAAFGDGSHERERKRKPKLDTVATKEIASDKWRGSNHTVGADPIKIVTQSDQRRKITITNRAIAPAIGTGHVFLSSLPSQANAPNTTLLPYDAFFGAQGRIIIHTKDDVYAVCAAGSGAILDVIEEFDMEC